MKLPKSLTTVTTFSKILAFLLFLALLLGAFYGGIEYSNSKSKKNHSLKSSDNKVEINYGEPNNWKTYTNEEFSFSLKHPSEADVINLGQQKLLHQGSRALISINLSVLTQFSSNHYLQNIDILRIYIFDKQYLNINNFSDLEAYCQIRSGSNSPDIDSATCPIHNNQKYSYAKIGGKNSFVVSDSIGEDVFVNHGNFTYHIIRRYSWFDNQNSLNAQISNITEEIISTLTFID